MLPLRASTLPLAPEPPGHWVAWDTQYLTFWEIICDSQSLLITPSNTYLPYFRLSFALAFHTHARYTLSQVFLQLEKAGNTILANET